MGTAHEQAVGQAEQRTRTLLDLKSDMASAHSSWMYQVVVAALEVSVERSKSGTKAIVGGQVERGIIKISGSRVSSPKNIDELRIRHQIKRELFDPKKWMFDAMNSRGGSWNFWGRFLEGGTMLFEAGTPIGRAIGVALYVDDVVSDLLKWKEKRESLALAKQYDVAYLSLSGKIRTCSQAISAALSKCGDVKAHVKSPPTSLGATFSWVMVAIAAAAYAQRSGLPVQQQEDLAKQAYKLYNVLDKHARSRGYLTEQLAEVETLRRLCDDVQMLLKKWANDPESIPFGELPVRVHGVRGSIDWLTERSRSLDGLVFQFVGLRDRCLSLYDELLGEIFLVDLSLGILAQSAYQSVKQSERARKPGVYR